MRLSGNYFDRLLLNILPYVIVGIIVIYFTKENTDPSALLFVLLILTVFFWTIDTLIIYIKFKKPKSLRINNAVLLLGNDVINPEDIVKITPVKDKRMRWTFKMIEFTLNDGRVFMIIDKPQTLIEDLKNKPSKTLEKLFEKYPELKTKLTTIKTI